MKTIKFYFENMLPPSVAQLAINNTKEHFLELRQPNLHEALSAAFVWSTSYKGQTYWEKVYEIAKGGRLRYNKSIVNGKAKWRVFVDDNMVAECDSEKEALREYGNQILRLM